MRLAITAVVVFGLSAVVAAQSHVPRSAEFGPLPSIGLPLPQIGLDGYCVGTLDDSNGELTLDTGPHQVELRADGYEPLRFNVQVFPDRSITYRTALKPAGAVLAPVPEVLKPPEVPPPARKMIYVIPGCYVGNVPPRDAGLPADCDANRA